MDSILKNVHEKLDIGIGIAGLIGILIITANVICRFILKISMSWSDEFLRTLFIYGYFIGAASMFCTGDLMRLVLLEDWLEKRGKKGAYKALRVSLSVINTAFFGFLTYLVYKGIIIPFIQSGINTSTSSTPAWLLPMGYGLGLLGITIFAIRDIINAGSKKIG